MVAVQYRPFWFRFFDSRLTGGIIAVAIFMALQAFANIFALGTLIAQQNMTNVPFHALAAILYSLSTVGLLKVNRKARFLALVISILMVVQGGIMMLYINLLEGMVTVVLYGLSAICLLSAKSRAVFYPPAADAAKK